MSLKDSALNQVRLNVKNDQTYTMTAALPFATLGAAVIQGYTTNIGDLGRATFTSNITSGTNFTLAANVAAVFADLIFINTGASNANNLFLSTSTVDTVYLRCVFKGSRANGLAISSATTGSNAYAIECEAYDCDKANSASQGGFASANAGGGMMFCYNCYSHDNTGSNANGFVQFGLSAMVLVNCIAESNGGSGAITASTAGQGLVCINSNFYNNTADGVRLGTTTASSWAVLINNNFLLNAKGVNNTVTTQGGILYNNGRGAGTQANTGADVLSCILDTGTDITYASNVTPWTAPTTGNFSTILAAAKGVGRGAFTETDGTNTGTIGYPDIGAAQAIVPAPSGGLRLAGSGGLAA